MKLKARVCAMPLLSTALCAFPTIAFGQDQPSFPTTRTVSASPGSAAVNLSDPLPGYDDIIVTARRREESAQTVPVSIAAFSGAALEQRNVRELRDLNAIVPGFRFSADGGKNTNTLTMRGLAKVPLGEGVPAVVSYFADVPVVGDGANLPTYDIASIQVLKGPQGTLFGRNTLGGAVLVAPASPTYEFGGYIRGDYGRFDYRALEGALNVPIVADRIAVRVAGQIRRQDPATRNLSGGRGFDDLHQDAFRVSLLLEPFEGLKSTTIYDYFEADEQPGGLYLSAHRPGVVPGLSALLDPQIAAYRAGQIAAGQYAVYSALNDLGRAYRKSWAILNNTTLDLGPISFRNIFGYRELTSNQVINTGGTGPLTLSTAPGVSLPFTLFIANAFVTRSYLTNEFHVLGNAFDDRLNFILGAFYNNDKPLAPQGSSFVTFSTTGAGAFTTAHAANTNKALFGQIGYKLTDRLTLEAGLRYSWDKVVGCGGSFPGTWVSFTQCKEVGALNQPDGIGVIETKGEEPSWTIGANYQASDDLFVYVTSRRGYRGANINSPLFETRFTTGGQGCSRGTTPVTCPDLRPFQRIGEEKLTDVEAGAKWDWEAGTVRGRLNVAAFYSKYKAALQFFNVVATGIPQGTPDFPNRQAIGFNAADETIKGVEVDATVTPLTGLVLSFNGALTDSSVDKLEIPSIGGLSLTKSDITLPTPKFSSTAAINWTVPIRPFDSELVLNADYFHTSSFDVQYGISLPGYDLVNARISLNDIAESSLSLAFAVRNLFNEEYFSASANLLRSFPTNTVYSGERRMWTLEAKYEF